MFEYINPDTKIKISLNIDDEKKIIIIYGKNGVGKTTFSRIKSFDKNYVFNLDFIHKNVYVIEEEGAKTSSKNKNSFSELFIGETAVKKQKYISLLSSIKKKSEEIYASSIQQITDILGHEFKQLLVQEILKLNDEKFNYEPKIEIEKILNIYKYPFVISNINDEEQFKQGYSRYKEKTLLGMLIGDLNESNLIKNVILNNNLSDLTRISENMVSLNEKLIYKKDLNDILESRSIKLKDVDKEWIEQGLKIQKYRSDCLLCGTKNIKSQIQKWDIVLNNIFVSEKTLINKFLNKQIKQCDSILSKKDQYEIVAPLLMKKLNELRNYLKETLENVANDNYTKKVEFINTKIEDLTLDTAKMMDNLVLYQLNKRSSELYATYKHSTNINVEIIKTKKEIEEYLENHSGKLVEELNKIFKIMKFSKKFEINIDRRAGIKYKFTISGKQINILSDGQRHKLALALFIKSIYEKGLENKTVVLDDPVVALDEQTYHAIRDLIINIRTEDNSVRVIILTHNIYYTYIQLSNIFENENIRKITSFYRMTSKEISELDINLLRTDDIVLFKKCISEILNEDEILILGGITCKIFRFILDIKLRFQGITSTLNPTKEIELLNLSSENILTLKSISVFLKRNCMLSRFPKTDIIIKCFEKLKVACEIFNINDYILDADIERFKSMSTNKAYSFDLCSENIYFDFVNSANKILYTEDYKELKNYLAHPRQQITKQITSISNDLK